MMWLFLILACTEEQAEQGSTVALESAEQKKEQRQDAKAKPFRQQQATRNGKKPHSPDKGVGKNPPPKGMEAPPKGGNRTPAFKATPSFQWSSTAKSEEEQKSIILISLDTVHAKRMEIYGGRAKTPHLKRFAQKAILFQQAISHFPETALSHWSMMTGVLPELHGNVPANGGSIYTGPTLAEIAQQQAHKSHDVKALKSVIIITRAMQEEQCDFSEGCWRLSVLLDSLKQTTYQQSLKLLVLYLLKILSYC